MMNKSTSEAILRRRRKRQWFGLSYWIKPQIRSDLLDPAGPNSLTSPPFFVLGIWQGLPGIWTLPLLEISHKLSRWWDSTSHRRSQREAVFHSPCLLLGYGDDLDLANWLPQTRIWTELKNLKQRFFMLVAAESSGFSLRLLLGPDLSWALSCRTSSLTLHIFHVWCFSLPVNFVRSQKSAW